MVTTSPIPFGPIARTVGNARTDGVGVQSRQGPSIDADFALINNWAATIDSRITVTYVSPIFTPAAGWAYDPSGGFRGGMLTSNGLVAVSLTFIYNGANTVADASGAYGFKLIGTMTDTRFVPSLTMANVHFVGGMPHGMCNVEFDYDGRILLLSGSFPAQPLNTGNYVTVTALYVPR